MLSAAACSSDAPPPAAVETPAPPAPPPAPPPPPASLLTGLPTDKNGPVLVVKIDNSAQARPHTGLPAADVVYVEPVEHGITRLAAVYSSSLPATVGPVRSARITDLELMAQYGRVAFAYSGAQAKFRPAIRRANMVEVVASKNVNRPGPGYFRVKSRTPPLNLYANAPALLARAKGAQPPRDIGFRFGPPVPGGRPAKAASTSFPKARVGFTWSPQRKQWLWVMDGKPGKDAGGQQIGASTVVFQFVKTVKSQYSDFTGANTPHAKTVGTGKAVVLRDGLAQSVTWSRANANAPTEFTNASGRVTFAPGKVWVVLVNASGKVSVS